LGVDFDNIQVNPWGYSLIIPYKKEIFFTIVSILGLKVLSLSKTLGIIRVPKFMLEG
jgi:hypothetical protein